MELLWNSDINITLQVQALGQWFSQIMRMISLFGTQEFFLLFLPAVLWCWNFHLGLRIGIILLLTGGINSSLKLLFQSPRPYWIDPRVVAYAGEPSFGFPSGHTQNATGVWGMLGWGSRKKYIILLSVFMIFLIGVSRIYLGVHFSLDVLGGLLFGLLILWTFVKNENRLISWLKTRSGYQLYGLVVFSSVFYLFIMLLPIIITPVWSVPVEWQQQAKISYPTVMVDPWNLKDIFTVAGTWFGLSVGLVWFYRKHGAFIVNGTVKEKLGRYFIGCTGIFLIWFGLGELLPNQPDYLGWIFRFFRYAMVGVWITALAPVVFYRMRIAKSRPIDCLTLE